MGWIAKRWTNVIWCTCLLLINQAAFSRPEPNNQTSQLGDEGGSGSAPSSESSDRAKEDAPAVSAFGNKTFNTLRSLPSARESANVSLEKLSQSMSRLEGSLGGLIQSFLAMQRSVSNLEQLQELLVLLLEDILKQTGNMAKSPKITKKELDINLGHSQDKASTESSEDDHDNSDVDKNDHRPPNTGPDEDNRGRDNVGDENYSAASGQGNAEDKQPSDPNANRGKEVTGGLTPEWTDGKNSGEVDSRDADSNSEDNDKTRGGKSHASQGRPPTATQDKGPNRSPQWAEPMTVGRGNILALFREAVSRLAAQQQEGQQFQQLRTLAEDHEVNAAHAESTAESPPRLFEPLEVKDGGNNFLDKSTGRETLPTQVRMRYLSHVVSHGGPVDGPEKSSSPFLDDLSEMAVKDNSGERPTGMINDLQLREDDHPKNDSTVNGKFTADTTTVKSENITSRAKRRKRRMVVISNKPTADGTNATAASVGNFQPQKNLAVDGDTLLNESFNQGFMEESNYTLSSIPWVNNSANATIQDAGDGLLDAAWQDFDHLVDALLKDLSAKLKEQQSHQMSSDAAIERAVYELNKLIWVASSDPKQAAQVDHLETGPERFHLISQPVSLPMEQAHNKNMHFITDNDQSINHTYTLQLDKKKSNLKMKQYAMGTSNIKDNDNNTSTRIAMENVPSITNATDRIEWLWLAEVPNAVNMPKDDLSRLAETLTELSQRPELAEELHGIIRRAWVLMQMKYENLDTSWLNSHFTDLEKSNEDAGLVKNDGYEDAEGGAEFEGEEEEESESRTPTHHGNSDNPWHDSVNEQTMRSTPEDQKDEKIQLTIDALKDLLQDVNAVSHRDKQISQSHSIFHDAETEDSEDGSHEDKDDEQRRDTNAVLQIRQSTALTGKQLQHIEYPDFIRSERYKRSRHKRLSGMLWQHLLNAQPPETANLGNQQLPEQTDGSQPFNHQTPASMHQSRNSSVPHSSGPISTYYQMNPYFFRRQTANEPWGQRLQRPFNHLFGYSNYLGHLGSNYPNWIHRSLEPDDSQPTDVLGSMETEDALAALFQRYWQRLFDVYSRSSLLTTTTEEPDLDGEDTTPHHNTTVAAENATTSPAFTPLPSASVITTDSSLLALWPDMTNNKVENKTLNVT